MKTRDEVLSQAAEECLKDFYNYAVPKVSWEDFLKENQEYTKKYNEWEKLENRPPIKEFCGPRPYEFYYLPSDIIKDIALSYVNVYRMDHQQELLDTIKILKDYCKKPIVDKYIDDWTDETGLHHPGYKSYDHPDNLEKELIEICEQHSHEPVNMAKEIQNKFFEFLDMAGNFFNWNRDLNSFNTTVYLGPSPNSNKQAVIDNWKQYRNKDIEIDEKQIKEDYYGEED
jgi:hypothetical protein